MVSQHAYNIRNAITAHHTFQNMNILDTNWNVSTWYYVSLEEVGSFFHFSCDLEDSFSEFCE